MKYLLEFESFTGWGKPSLTSVFRFLVCLPVQHDHEIFPAIIQLRCYYVMFAASEYLFKCLALMSIGAALSQGVFQKGSRILDFRVLFDWE